MNQQDDRGEAGEEMYFASHTESCSFSTILYEPMLPVMICPGVRGMLDVAIDRAVTHLVVWQKPVRVKWRPTFARNADRSFASKRRRAIIRRE